MNERIEKVKRHFRENKKVYVSCGVTAVVTAVGTALVLSKPEIIGVKQEINQPLSWKPTAHNNFEIFIEALGDPGNIVQDTVTGTVYASQGQAAKELGVRATDISRHLNGHSPNVGGHVLKRLGKAPVHVAE